MPVGSAQAIDAAALGAGRMVAAQRIIQASCFLLVHVLGLPVSCSPLCSNEDQPALGRVESLEALAQLHDAILRKDWPSAVSEAGFSLDLRAFVVALKELSDVNTAPSTCEASHCSSIALLDALRLALQECSLVPTATSAVFLLHSPSDDVCCGALRAAAYVASAEALSQATSSRLAGSRSETGAFLRKGQEIYISWLQWLQHHHRHEGAALVLQAFLAPGTLELFQILFRSTCPYSQRHQGLSSGCPHSMALQDITRRWMASFRDSFSCRAWLEHMQSESLLAVEFFTPGALDSVCLLDALRALDSACAEDGIKARALLLSTEGEPGIRLAMSHEWSRRISFDAAPLQQLRDDCEIPILMLDVPPGKQMEILRSMAQLLSQGRVFGILTRLYNPHHWPAADDPLSVYEFLVWHGYLPGPLDDPESTYTAVGTVQLEVATAGATTDIPIIALPRQLRPPPRSASHPEVAEAFTSALRGSCVAAQDHRPNSWVEVDLEEVRKRLRRIVVQVSLPKPTRSRRLSALLASDAFGHDVLLAGLALAASPHVVALFVESMELALHLMKNLALVSTRPKRQPQVVLLHQPPRSNLCSLVEQGVAIAVQSFRWLRANHNRCEHPVEIHLEVDTGIGRTGLRPGIALAAIYFVLQRPNRFLLRGIYTKLCCIRDLVLTGKALRQISRMELRAQAVSHGSGRARRFSVQVGGGLARSEAAPIVAALPPSWWIRLGQGLFGDPALGNLAPLAMTWKTSVSSTGWLPENTHLGYCPQGADCHANRTQLLTGTYAAILPVGFAEFHGEAVWSRSGLKLSVLNSAASTTSVEFPEHAPLKIGEEVTLCSNCPLNTIPWSIPRFPKTDAQTFISCSPVVW
eukprot:s98_g20.t1